MNRLFYVIHRSWERLVLILDEYAILTRNPGVKIGNQVLFSSIEKVSLGRNTEIAHGVKVNCGDDQAIGYFKCGEACYIGHNSVIFAAGGITLGNDVLISPSVNLISHQHTFSEKGKKYQEQETSYKEISIGNNVWIGSNATILPGVKIGENAIIGANALVNTDIPKNTMSGGVPAKVLKALE